MSNNRFLIIGNIFNSIKKKTGIMGLTGIIGFLFYLVSVFGLWFLLLLKAGSNWKKYFINRQSLLTSGFLGGLCTYVLFWTFLYGMVHVYWISNKMQPLNHYINKASATTTSDLIKTKDQKHCIADTWQCCVSACWYRLRQK